MLIQLHFVQNNKNPKVYVDIFLRQAATDIITILTAPPSTTTIPLQSGNPIRNALFDITQILNRTNKLSTLPVQSDKQLVPMVATDLAR